MKSFTKEIRVRTSEHDQMLDITSEVADAVVAAGVTEGTAVIYVPHTTGEN